MGLRDGYGVLLGSLVGYQRDDPNDFGRYMHGVLTLATPAGQYKCAVDVDTQRGAVPIHWRVQPLRSAEWATLFALPDGWHRLTSMPSSGAVDYIRDPRLHELLYIPDYAERRVRVPFPPGEWPGFQLPHQSPIRRTYDRAEFVGAALTAGSTSVVATDANVETSMELLRAPVGPVGDVVEKTLKLSSSSGKVVALRTAWNAGSSAQALLDLEAVISNPQRVMVFGAPFRGGPGVHHQNRGVHDIHQNQGDPIGEGHDEENAIWQDGITIAFRNDGTASAFMNKFHGQADATDDNGHPIPP